MTLALLVDVPGDEARFMEAAQAQAGVHFRPPPTLMVSEWADQYRILPATSAESGRWHTGRVPYMREVMDTCSNRLVERVVLMKASQVGYSEVLLNVLGYFIHQDPAPVMFVQISTGEAEKFSKERIQPMVDGCPALAERVAEQRSRDSSNTIDAKEFPGGHLGIVGANAPSGLRSRARRVVLFDEVDGYPPSAGKEGDPIDLARKRQSTFWNRLEVTGSTPTIADVSRIEEAVLECHELRRYHVPCPHCAEMQPLEWGGKDAAHGVKWAVDEHGQAIEVAYYCRACHAAIDEKYKSRMLAKGEWRVELGKLANVRAEERPAHPAPTRIAFHIPGTLSPWVTWAELAQEWLDAQGHFLKMQVFVNTRLGETWDAQGASVDADPLYRRREEYAAEPVPAGVVLITAGVDVQADRLEVEFVGWGLNDESWSLDYLRIPGDPSTDDLWKLLEKRVVQRVFMHPCGVRLMVRATAVDSGFMTQQVYKFVKDRRFQNVWAIKGIEGPGKPIMGRPTIKNKLKVPLYPVGMDASSLVLNARLGIEEPGPGFCHFPKREPYDEEFFRQLTSEKMVLKQSPNGSAKRVWVVRHGRRTETRDARRYATAALEGLIAQGVRVEAEASVLVPQTPEPETGPSGDDGPDWATGGGRWGGSW